MSDDNVIDPQAERAIAKVRLLMLIAGATTFIALAAVLGVIGYRLFHLGGRAQALDVTEMVPQGARIVSVGASADRIVVTVDIGGAVEVRTFDADTLKPTGRLSFPNAP
jgi:hypothetical protein